VQLKGKKILVTGGAGFLGSHLCERLLAERAEVRVFDSFASGKEENIAGFKDRVDIVKGELSDRRSLIQGASGIDVVVHTAFPMGIRERNYSFFDLHRVSAGFFNVLDVCLNEKALLVQISSVAVYGNPKYTPVDENHPLEPETVYGAVKMTEEAYCRIMSKCHGLRTVILRVADIFGPRNTRISVPINFLLKAIHNVPIVVDGDGSQGRSYTYVSDFCDAVVGAVVSGRWGEVVNVAGDYVSILELARETCKVVGGNSEIVIDEKKHTDSRQLDIDIRQAAKMINFYPRVTLAEGLQKTYGWIKEHLKYYQ